MAQLLGGKFCIKSLRSDVADVHSSVVEILSHVGPIRHASWKYPDRLAVEVDVGELLERYDYVEDGRQVEEERQIAHVVLLEMVIDRLVLLLQATGQYIELMQQKQDGRQISSAASPSSGVVGSETVSSSVGPTVRRCLGRLLAYCNTRPLTVQNSRQNEDIKSKITAKSMGLEESLANSDLSLRNSSRVMSAPPFPCPLGVDECSKACQTFDTMFCACDACDVTQSYLREAAETVVQVCRTLGIASHLQKHRDSVTGLAWLSGRDVLRWVQEQKKDQMLIAESVTELQRTVETIKSQLSKQQKRNKQLANQLSESKKQIVIEKESLNVALKQYQAHIQELERLKVLAKEAEEKELKQWRTERSRLETELLSVTSELSENVETRKQLEKFKEKTTQELEERLQKQYTMKTDTLNQHIKKLEEELKMKEDKLTKVNIELNKEKCKAASASKHSETIQSRQSSLIKRVEEMDQENEDLKTKILELEESLESIKQERTKFLHDTVEERSKLKNVSAEQCLTFNSSSAQSQVLKLQQLLSEAAERERLLVDYPHIHQLPDNLLIKGCLVSQCDNNNRKLLDETSLINDMSRQISANTLRINLLSAENSKLQNSILKLSEVSLKNSQPDQHRIVNTWSGVQDRIRPDEVSFKNCLPDDHIDFKIGSSVQSWVKESEFSNGNGLQVQQKTLNAECRVQFCDKKGAISVRNGLRHQYSDSNTGSGVQTWVTQDYHSHSKEKSNHKSPVNPIHLWKYDGLERSADTITGHVIDAASTDSEPRPSSSSGSEPGEFVVGRPPRADLRLHSGGRDRKREGSRGRVSNGSNSSTSRGIKKELYCVRCRRRCKDKDELDVHMGYCNV